MSRLPYQDKAEAAERVKSHARRIFFSKVGKAALAAPAATSLIVAAASKPTTAEAAYSTRPGWGYGDTNHNHSGPPGLIKKAGPK
jgi:hypothetical protein